MKYELCLLHPFIILDLTSCSVHDYFSGSWNCHRWIQYLNTFWTGGHVARITSWRGLAAEGCGVHLCVCTQLNGQQTKSCLSKELPTVSGVPSGVPSVRGHRPRCPLTEEKKNVYLDFLTKCLHLVRFQSVFLPQSEICTLS